MIARNARRPAGRDAIDFGLSLWLAWALCLRHVAEPHETNRETPCCGTTIFQPQYVMTE